MAPIEYPINGFIRCRTEFLKVETDKIITNIGSLSNFFFKSITNNETTTVTFYRFLISVIFNKN